MTPAEVRAKAEELEREDDGNAELLAALADWDPALLRQALLGETGSGFPSRLLREALDAGRAEIARRLTDHPGSGRSAASAYAFLAEQIARLAFDFVTTRLYPNHNPTTAERLSLVATVDGRVVGRERVCKMGSGRGGE